MGLTGSEKSLTMHFSCFCTMQ